MCTNNVLLNSDEYTYEYFLQSDVCRLCWGRNANQEISPKTLQKQETLKNELVDKIINCLDLDFRDGSCPKKACSSCILKVEEFHEFKTFCRETDRRLKEILSKYLNKDAEEPNIDVKIEKIENEITDLAQSKQNLIEQSNDFLNYLNDSNNVSDCEPSENETTLEEIVPVKKRRRRFKKPSTYCPSCRIDLETDDSFSTHNAKEHGIKDGLFKCFGCEKHFKSKKTRLGHEINFCKGLKDGYKCPKCERYLPKRRTYEAHMRDHRDNAVVELPENLFRCFKCFQFFKTRDILKEHMAEHETNKNYICETCGRVFTRRDYLYKHKLTHSGTKRHVCPHCGFRTAQRSSLTMHIRRHTGERPYVCDVCPQRCVSSSNLRAHRRRHLPLKHYECTVCNKKFGYKISLEEHVAAAHERSAQFTCALCGAAYTRLRGLRRHLLAKHGKRAADGDTRQEDKMADEYLKATDEGKKEEVIKEVGFEVKAGEEFMILNEEVPLVEDMY